MTEESKDFPHPYGRTDTTAPKTARDYFTRDPEEKPLPEMVEVPSFTVSGWYEVKSHKVAACIADPELTEQGYWTPRQLRGKRVRLDGELHKVIATEAYAVGCSEDNPYKLTFGLMVE